MTANPDDLTHLQRADAGDTLIEVLIALLILSITVVALLSAFSTSIAASAEYRNIAVTDSVVRTLSEQVIAQFQQGTTYIACPNATPATYLSGYSGSASLTSALTIPAPYTSAGYSASLSAVGYWTGNNFDGTPSTCSIGSTVPEQLTITITGPSGTSETLTFIVEGSGQIFSIPPGTLDPPTNLVLTTPADSGGLVVSFTASANAPANSLTFTQYYTVVACVNASMTQGCTSTTTFQSGQEISGLAPGTPYWVSVVANASPGYLASPPATAGPQDSSGTALVPEVTSVTPSTTTAGALVVTFTPPGNAPSGETYTANACTDSGMSANCVSVGAFTSGSAITGLAPGTPYYVEVTANPNSSAGYPGATSIPFSPPVASTEQLYAPSVTNVSSSSIQSGALVVTYSPSSNAPSGQTYTVTGCTDQNMTQGCVSQADYASSGQFTGLSSGTSYYVTITANASTGYLASTSTPTTSATMASIQLTPPTIRRVTAATGALKVSVIGSSNAPQTETYTATACTNTSMTSGCTSQSTTTTKSNFSVTITNLTSGTTYYITVIADAPPGYLTSNPSAQATGVPN